jgi:hypothetical protein
LRSDECLNGSLKFIFKLKLTNILCELCLLSLREIELFYFTKVRMLENLFGARSLVIIFTSHQSYYLNALWRDFLPKLSFKRYLIFHNRVHDIFNAFSSEWNLSGQQMIHSNAGSPHVNFFCVFLVHNLRCHISWSSNSRCQNLSRLNLGCNTKVYQFNVRRVISLKQDILRLYVSMNHANIVQIDYSP